MLDTGDFYVVLEMRGKRGGEGGEEEKKKKERRKTMK